jgi:DedD protein
MADAMTSDSASRVTRSRRSLQRSLLLTAAVLAGVTVLRAQETPPAAPPATAPQAEASAPPAAAKPAGTEPAGAKPAEPAADAPAPATGKAGAKVGPTRDRFEPTEKVRADFDVSFPVDI